MRILGIRGHNLASLAGTFEVDLATGPLARVGLFAITGPTGSGKSTLLDALCLALFEKTPRLRGKSTVRPGRPDEPVETRLTSADARSLLRRGTVQGWAEVEFIGRDGRRYISRWSVHRARSSPNGRFQDAELALTDPEGRVLGSGRSETREIIADRLGLTFEQFCRSVLLAQGDFAAFLRAGEGERGLLLERMTGTEIYSQLSMAAHERAAAEARRVRELETSAGLVEVLANPERAAIKGRLKTLERELPDLEARAERLRHAASWHQSRKRYEAEREEARESHEAADRAWQEAAAERLELSVVERVQALRGPVEQADRQREAVERAARHLAAQQQDLQRSEERLDEARRRLRELLGKAAGLRRRAERDLESVTARFTKLEAAWQEAEAARVAHPSTPLQSALDRQKDHEQRLQGLSVIVQTISQARQRTAEAGIEAQEAEQAKEEAEREERAAQAGADSLAERLAEARGNLDRLRAARELEAHRHDLRPGSPCPLCGATEHPWAREAPPLDRLQVEAEERVETLQADHEKHVKRKAAAQALWKALKKQVHEAHRRVAAGTQEEQHALTRWAQLAERLEPPLDPVPDPAALESRQRAVDDEVTRIRARLTTAKRLETVAQEKRRALDAERQSLARAEACVQTARALRRSEEEGLLPDGPGEQEAIEAASARPIGPRLEQIARELDTGREAHRQGREAVSSARAAAQIATRTLEEARTSLVEADTRRDQELASYELELDTARKYLAYDDDWMAARRRELQRLQSRLEQTLALRQERIRRLSEHLQRDPPDLEETEAEQALADVQQELQKRRDRVAELRAALAYDDEARQKSDELARKATDQRQAARLWTDLDALIGSHSGKAFRVFAQSLTLERLLARANVHLEDLAPRYRLMRVPGTDLDLQVVDRDLGEDIRSIASLSGGETFLVSLALALGLASLSSVGARLESLFIDEGFGSLDADTLEMALHTLDQLQSDGRQIGLISHVSGLAERIGAQVRLIPRGVGRSVVQVTAGT